MTPPRAELFSVSCTQLPRDGDRDSKRAWRERVRAACDGTTLEPGDVFLDIAVATPLSLKDVLKPVIDGLEPLLGRDPHGRLEFCPRDERVTWLRAVRQAEGDVLRVVAGVVQAGMR